MGKPVVGDIVILEFPQTDLQPGKRRPAMVVADLTRDDLILRQITSQSHSDNYSAKLTSADFERGRLNVDSFARPNRLFTVQQSVILYTAADANPAKVNEVKAAARRLFA